MARRTDSSHEIARSPEATDATGGALMRDAEQFLAEHTAITRRIFLRLGAVGLAANSSPGLAGSDLARVLAKLGLYFTPQDEFRDVSRGKPLPHSLPAERKREVGLTRDTWRLEVLSDPDHPAALGRQLTRKDGTALDFTGLLRLGERHGVRFAKVMTCLNIGCPLGMGIWEGVPLRDVLWLTRPRENLRRVFYYGYHNDDPKQMFRSSLPVGRVLDDGAALEPAEAPRGRHSDKPDQVRGLVEQASPGPRLELFGRRPVSGWTVFGNEIERTLFHPDVLAAAS
jgi:hypothetical protein